jgi:hypothetical protein
MNSMTQTTKPLHDDENYRLFEVYEASYAKEHSAASKVLIPRENLSHSGYMKLLEDLRAIRMECNQDMLAIATHHEKMRELVMVY